MNPHRITCRRTHQEHYRIAPVKRALVLLCSACTLPVIAATHLPEDLTELGLEDVLNIDVTLASKRSHPIVHTASAIFAIAQKDIRRSGANRIPEVLRMATKLHMAKHSFFAKHYADIKPEFIQSAVSHV
mgnify:CR=1 FL=1